MTQADTIQREDAMFEDPQAEYDSHQRPGDEVRIVGRAVWVSKPL